MNETKIVTAVWVGIIVGCIGFWSVVGYAIWRWLT